MQFCNQVRKLRVPKEQARFLQEDNIVTWYMTVHHNAILQAYHFQGIKTLLKVRSLVLSGLAMLNARSVRIVTQIHYQ